MQNRIAELVTQFEKGAVSRRDLIRSLAALAAAGGVASVARSQETPFESAGIDHISIQVTDLPRSVAFYRDVFGLDVLDEDRENLIVRMGVDRVIVSLHQKAPTGIVDHYAIAVRNFDRESVTAALERHGLTPETNLDYGFHVRDPEGVPVQIVGG